MITEEDIRLMNSLSVKIHKKLDRGEGNKELYEELKKLTKKEKQTIFTISSKGNKTMGEIAEGLGVTVSTPTTTVNRLIDKGYVCRHTGQEDRRQVLVSLTEKGKKFYEEIISIRKKNLKIVFDALSDIELDMFRRLMQKLDNIL